MRIPSASRSRPATARRAVVVAALLAGVLGLNAATAQERTLRAAINEQTTSDRSAVRSQAQIDNMANETAELLGEYRASSQELDRLLVYNGHLQKLVDDQQSEIDSMQNQIDNFQNVEQEIIPLMMNMIDGLERFIELDMPFNMSERRDRVARLRGMMDDSNVSVSEKYRQIMEAYQIETEFGRDIEASTGPLEKDGSTREVEFFRVGRILLAYQTNDRGETGFWNKLTGSWEELGDEYRNFVTEGLRIAKKQSAPNLLKLPVPAPEAAQ